jgi:hypothetical protein
MLAIEVASHVIFHMEGDQGQGPNIVIDSFIFRQWEFPWTPQPTITPPWVMEVMRVITHLGMQSPLIIHGDGSYVLNPSDPESFGDLPSPDNAYVAGGIVIAEQSRYWRDKPSIVIQVQNGQTLHMDCVFPMELLVLEMGMILSKHLPGQTTVTSDCLGAIQMARQSM